MPYFVLKKAVAYLNTSITNINLSKFYLKHNCQHKIEYFVKCLFRNSKCSVHVFSTGNMFCKSPFYINSIILNQSLGKVTLCDGSQDTKQSHSLMSQGHRKSHMAKKTLCYSKLVIPLINVFVNTTMFSLISTK